MYTILLLINLFSTKDIANKPSVLPIDTAVILSSRDSITPKKETVKIKELEFKKKVAKSRTNSTTVRSEKVGTSPRKPKQPKENKTTDKRPKEVGQSKADSSQPQDLNSLEFLLTEEEQIALLAKKEESSSPEDKLHPDEIQKCALAFDVVDEFTGRKKKGLFARNFFTFTPDNYRKFLKNKDFIRCDGYLTESTGKLMTLNLKLVVESKEARNRFGNIKAGFALVLHGMDDKEFYLLTYAGAVPKVLDNKTIYECSFAINKSDLKKLRDIEIDCAKIVFDRGAFSYDIYYLDFLKDQFPCFD